MKKTVLVLGCLLAIGFSSVSCNRDDGLPETQVAPTLQRSDLPKEADHLVASMLGETIYDATFTNKTTPNPFLCKFPCSQYTPRAGSSHNN